MGALKTKNPFDTKGMSAHIPMSYYTRRNDNGGHDLAIDAGIDALVDELAVFDRALRTNEIKSIAEFYRLAD